MATISKFVLFSLLICLSSSSTTSSKFTALVLPITKHPTLQYITHLTLGTPPAKIGLVLDIGGPHIWFDCINKTSYNSSTSRPGICGSAACSVAKGFCIPNRAPCDIHAQNNIFGTLGTAFVEVDKIAVHSTDGSKAGPVVTIPNIIFGCSETFSLTSLADGTKGMLGLSKERVSLPSQLSSLLNAKKFAICLPSKPNTDGVLFLGKSPYKFYPGYNTSRLIDVTSRFKYTKLHTNYQRTATARIQGPPLSEYFVKITSILVNNKPIKFNRTLLEFQRTGAGGSKITTVKPYTTFESSIYRAFVKVFDAEIISTWKVKKVEAVPPFSDCYTYGNLGMSLLGLGVPDISFVFEDKFVRWDIYGANSMVEISKDVICLGIIDGGSDVHIATYIDIGAHQLQDNLLEFDLASSRLGFTNTLLFDEIECSNFKF
ncbi:probable aspartic proteinase GIP2 [Euphorbia lathyris]|uniref:probable aspartic proteinase GIP2 n=1 Tax=Euphorbia lathyris TaxID=212925 RepID=UPI0033142732